MLRDDPTPTTSRTLPLPLRAFADDVATDLATFRRRHGEAFLVHQGPLDALGKLDRAQVTVFGPTAERRRRSFDKPLVVFPVRTTPYSAFPTVVCVGRARHNDIVLSDPSVSKLHAVFKRNDAGWLLQDARSRNGTFVDDVPVPVETRGEPVRVSSGSSVRLGDVELVFLDAAELRTLAAATRR